jgi:transitional endoplasmic reticulum ATPase
LDDNTIGNLRAAYSQSPDNLRLLVILLQAHETRGEIAAAWDLLLHHGPERFADVEDRLIAGRIAVAAGHADQTLARLDTDAADPREVLLRAKAFQALNKYEEARLAYRAAISANAALEDPAMETLLGARVVQRGSGPEATRLRVISNDDTTADEIGRLIEPKQAEVKFADVGGLEDVKRQIEKKIILPFRKPGLFQKFRKRVGGGILLYGPPGCGKTLLARATAGECGARFFNVAISDVLDMYIGESEQKLHSLFEKARQNAPSVMFFDEIEALGGKRQYTRESTSSKLVSQFLSEMDGYTQQNHGVLILGATNVPWAVDPAFRRPGRFDRVIFVPPPDVESRRSILRGLLKHRPAEDHLDIDRMADQTSGFSGADLQQIIESAADEAIEASIADEREVPISMAHLNTALRETHATTLEWLTTARNYARYANEGGQYDDVLDFLKRHGKE